MLRTAYSSNWNALVVLLLNSSWDRKKRFCVAYTFQATIYAIWRERNMRREQPMAVLAIKKTIEKGIHNKLSLVRAKRGKGVTDILQFWFSTRM
ncbi:hypothetical protein F2Q70_00003730 [Brassica cretica]|uniref:Uncharacterized protein n=1 Tax=Brassica cretica TaxID=69181 RepID=A0A8S9IM94_BRACR|nr:hypothetical protein F2Q70_00003730 [Brassica cretica]